MEIKIKKENNKVWTVKDKNGYKFLHTPVKNFDFLTSEIATENIINHIRSIMYRYGGVGLSANQIGLNVRMFVAQLPDKSGKGYSGKFYVLFNPEIVSYSKNEYYETEGCLSIPKTYGMVCRYKSIKVKGKDKKGKDILINAKGFIARIFQHEIDHLDGILFTDKAKDIRKIDEL